MDANNVWTVVGITSYGNAPNRSKDVYCGGLTVYTEVAGFMGYIETMMRNEE